VSNGYVEYLACKLVILRSPGAGAAGARVTAEIGALLSTCQAKVSY